MHAKQKLIIKKDLKGLKYYYYDKKNLYSFLTFTIDLL